MAEKEKPRRVLGVFLFAVLQWLDRKKFLVARRFGFHCGLCSMYTEIVGVVASILASPRIS